MNDASEQDRLLSAFADPSKTEAAPATQTIVDDKGRVLVVDHDGKVVRDTGLEAIHPQRAQGRRAGREAGGGREPNTAVYDAVIDATLAAVLDETKSDHDREMSGQYGLGFAEGWASIVHVEPLQFLTRIQTARVDSLPRDLRRAWLAEFHKAVRKWNKGGGSLSGRRIVLPAIP